MDTFITRREFEEAMAKVATKSEVRESIENAVKDLEIKMMRRFDSLTEAFEEKFSKIDEKFAKVDEKFDKIDVKFNKIDAILNQILKKVSRKKP